jgi:exonuclease SbcD
MKLLCSGDLHLGRRSSRLPDSLSEYASVTVGWNHLVDYAIDERVNAVLLSGDLVDKGDRYLEASEHLQRGIRRLSGRGIVTVAVAGNHDFNILPKIADELRHAQAGGDKILFHLLGVGGVWESCTLRDSSGRPELVVAGWSFPSEHVKSDPMATFAVENPDGLPVIGLLHADLDQNASAYAPVTAQRLNQSDARFWLLGHVHAPGLEPGSAGLPSKILYPGSLQGMDPGEMGAHGPWRMETSGEKAFLPVQKPLSPIRYENVEVSLNGLEDIDELGQRVRQQLREHYQQIETECSGTRGINCRVVLTGRTACHSRLPQYWERLTAGDSAVIQIGDTALWPEKAIFATRPALDLENYRGSRDAAGAVTRMLLALTSSQYPDERKQLIDDAQVRLNDKVWNNPSFSSIAPKGSFGVDTVDPDAPPDREEIAAILIRDAYALLEALIENRGAGAQINPANEGGV